MRYRPRVTIRELILLVVIVALAAAWWAERRRAARWLEILNRREEVRGVPILDPIEGESDT